MNDTVAAGGASSPEAMLSPVQDAPRAVPPPVAHDLAVLVGTWPA